MDILNGADAQMHRQTSSDISIDGCMHGARKYFIKAWMVEFTVPCQKTLLGSKGFEGNYWLGEGRFDTWSRSWYWALMLIKCHVFYARYCNNTQWTQSPRRRERQLQNARMLNAAFMHKKLDDIQAPSLRTTIDIFYQYHNKWPLLNPWGQNQSHSWSRIH